MAFENVSEYKLNSALRKIDNISSSRIDDLIGDMDYDDWQSNTRVNIIEALKEIQKEYKQIESKISKYKQVADYIDEYKSVQDKYEYYNDALSRYKRYYNNSDEDSIFNLRDYYQGRIESSTASVNSNRAKMNDLMNKINNLMG